MSGHLTCSAHNKYAHFSPTKFLLTNYKSWACLEHQVKANTTDYLTIYCSLDYITVPAIAPIVIPRTPTSWAAWWPWAHHWDLIHSNKSSFIKFRFLWSYLWRFSWHFLYSGSLSVYLCANISSKRRSNSDAIFLFKKPRLSGPPTSMRTPRPHCCYSDESNPAIPHTGRGSHGENGYGTAWGVQGARVRHGRGPVCAQE